MPNFKVKKIKKLILPFRKDEVELEWMAENDNVILIYTKVNEESFFLQVKKEKDSFIIKGDKHTKPSKIAYLQKSLQVFRDYFCHNEDIISEAFAFKHNALIEKTSLIAYDFDQLLAQIKGKIYIEIGFGSGRHLLYQAKNNPDVLVIGIEIYNPAITQVAKLAKKQNINNILLIQSDARLLLSVLKPNSVEKIFLHFPVPWDKKPHRRVIARNFCEECARVLGKNGRFELRTDSCEYFDFTLKQFLCFNSPKFTLKKNENLEISSKYEDRWKKQNKDIFDLWVWNLDNVCDGLNLDDFDFSDITFNANDLILLEKNFKNLTLKGDDYFLHFENLYQVKEGLIFKIAFGAFNKPEHCYIGVSKNIEFLFKKPFKIKENLKAIEKLKKVLKFHFDVIVFS
ncbi:tRNA (guanosine(46)-N7)-methyltransferase TrmB [Campylobacter estrildidarum]|uniref:tRNA (guanine-N(7)-)-methyltransferase n=1 Tax=Campylobacter estrildidarum TaxID=2510189 RepID=A0A4U7BP76_9BACT|nr:tRNA (guanosine(46)-N7)-methyltransferase TrmB [Campylobacter estrildidarum]TKX32030.1 tRNA (guanosine(46)-N7)-methyltransferase TrmB [Campylobacter estrildidarum]